VGVTTLHSLFKHSILEFREGERERERERKRKREREKEREKLGVS
jgi:hypothetical protein